MSINTTTDNVNATNLLNPHPVSVSGGVTVTGGATESTLAAVKAKTDNLDIALSTLKAVVDLIKASTDKLDVALSTRTKPADTQTVAGIVSVSNLPATQPVSAAALPLPTGAATEAKQTTGNTSLASIDGKIPALGQAAMAASAPVVIASNQSNLPIRALTSVDVVSTNVRDGGGNSLVSVANGNDRGLVVTDLEFDSYRMLAPAVAIGNGKSMISLLNQNSNTRVRIKAIYVRNSQTVAITGVLANFELRRITGHSSGSTVTIVEHDTSRALGVSISGRTGATVSGEGALLDTFIFPTDEQVPTGATNSETLDAAQNYQPIRMAEQGMRAITLNSNQGIHIKQTVNSTAGTFDFLILFTTEFVAGGV